MNRLVCDTVTTQSNAKEKNFVLFKDIVLLLQRLRKQKIGQYRMLPRVPLKGLWFAQHRLRATDL